MRPGQFDRILFITAALAAFLLVGATVLFLVRGFSNAVTTVRVIEPEPGVRCAKMVTADGAAISCWLTRNVA